MANKIIEKNQFKKKIKVNQIQKPFTFMINPSINIKSSMFIKINK